MFKCFSSSKPFWFHDYLLTFFLHSQTKWTRNSSKNPFLFKRTAVEWFRCMTDCTCVVCGFVFLSQQLLLTFVINGKLTMRAERREAKMPPCWRELEGVCSCISVRWYFMMYKEVKKDLVLCYEYKSPLNFYLLDYKLFMHKCKHNPTFALDRGFCTQSRLSSSLSSVYHFVTSPPLFPSPVSSRSSPCSSSLPCLLHFRVPLISSSPSPPLFLSVTLSGFVMAAVIQQDVMRRGEGRKGDVPRGTRSNGILLLSAPDRMSSC